MTDQFVEVVNAVSVSFAILAGLAVGYVAVGKYASDPAYASGEATPTEYGFLIAGLTAAAGTIFFGFQVLGAVFNGDDLWPRILARLGVWCLYSAAIGAGTAIRLARHVRHKHAQAQANAVRELDQDQ